MSKQKPIRVLATGVFDLLHPGHIHYLEAAKNLGDELIVIIANDTYVTNTKGVPLFSAAERKHMVAALSCVDTAIVPEITDSCRFYETVLATKPDIIALGFDQHWDEVELAQTYATYGWHGTIVRLDQFPGATLSSSQLKQKIKNT
jgi:FAD synthetase